MSRVRSWSMTALVLMPALLAALAWCGVAFVRQGGAAPYRVPAAARGAVSTDAATIARGRQLAQIGNCQGCHSVRGGMAYAGGRAFKTPYGTVYSSNLTPDPAFGIGDWSLQEFRHVMRHGVSRNGVQSPVFPYANFALLDDADLDALYAFLGTLAPVARGVPENAYEFPANLPGAMTAWRLAYYRPEPLSAATGQSDAWRRGRYLVNGIGHCGVCHSSRSTFASLATDGFLGGERIPGWYAPPLDRASLARYNHGELARYLRSGTSDTASAYGTMADVVFRNLQHLSAADAQAIETYLRSIPAQRTAARLPAATVATSASAERLYQQHCADCHGDDGRGKPGKYPPLAGSVAVMAPEPVNAVNVLLLGAMPPATATNPRPYSMPPFAHRLSAEDIAALVNLIRQRWGVNARAISAAEVHAMDGVNVH